jgi:hypothetical protein
MENKYILSEQISLYGEADCIGFGNSEFYVKEINRDLAIKIIINNHYSKKVYNGTFINLGLFQNNKIVGVLQYGYAMNPASCGSVVKDTNMDEYLELNRMWLSDEITIKYAESQAISYSIKYIKRKYPKIKWIQSFADERCGGFGIVYQACSFSYYGEHKSTFWELDNVVYHNSMMTSRKAGGKKYDLLQANKDRCTSHTLRQFRYIKFINQKWKKKCLLKEMPYPKHYENK